MHIIIVNKFHFDEMVVERNVNVKSSCEHHLQTIDGFATVGYIPKKVVLGLSKLNRIVEYFSKRPQVQERLTCQIHAALKYILDTENVAVVIDARCAECGLCVGACAFKAIDLEHAHSKEILGKIGEVLREPAGVA